jgi:AAA15 family ATPase/GTPase
MLDSLEIQNYRNFKHLRIEKLGRVNLIIGKNNTGKTSLLEAVSLYVGTDKFGALKEILTLRGDYDEENYRKIETDKFNENTRLLSSIFNGRSYAKNNEIIISGSKNTPLTIKISIEDDGHKIQYYQNETTKRSADFENPFLGRIFSKDETYNWRFIPANCICKDNSENWSKIALTDNEKYVIQTLNIIDKSIERFTYVIERNELKSKVSLNTGEVVNLRSMGDGINRILTIMLSMVNCKDGYLLIDEFDNGLYVSVQKQLWEIVFYLANKLNIQVFATTHSHDCIDAFADVLGSGKYAESDGIMVRLDNYEGNIDATIYESDDIFNTIRAEVDPR